MTTDYYYTHYYLWQLEESEHPEHPLQAHADPFFFFCLIIYISTPANNPNTKVPIIIVATSYTPFTLISSFLDLSL